MQRIKGREAVAMWSSEHCVLLSEPYTNWYSEEVVNVRFEGDEEDTVALLKSLELVPLPRVSLVSGCVMQDSIVFDGCIE